MKICLTILLSLHCFFSQGQSCDLIYLPKSQNIVATYNLNDIPVGMYLGGDVKTIFPTPFLYYTPLSRLNRIGVSIGTSKADLMFGGFIQNFRDSIVVYPDFWLKVHPLRLMTKTKNGFDFVLAINYMKTTNYGIGLSIPFGNIYGRW